MRLDLSRDNKWLMTLPLDLISIPDGFMWHQRFYNAGAQCVAERAACSKSAGALGSAGVSID